MPASQRWTDPRCTDLDMPYGGRFIELSDGRLFTVQNNTTLFSSDDGKTWEDGGPVYTGRKPGVPGSGPMIKTEDGVIVMLFADMSTFRSSSRGWNDAAGKAPDDVRLDVWSIRSLDEGQTWQDRHRVLEGYCGAMINMIQMSRNGPIVAPIQDLWYDPDRNVQPVFTSGDNGKSWTKSNVIDLGGHGHHDGAMESIVIELNDRRVWMLIRTNWDYFWEAYSMDEGLSWRVIQPTNIDASSAPGYILRLASGRMVLVWNRLYPEGATSYQRRAGAYSSEPGSWHREELSIAFSEDDGASWTDPVVLAKEETGPLLPVRVRAQARRAVDNHRLPRLRPGLHQRGGVGLTARTTASPVRRGKIEMGVPLLWYSHDRVEQPHEVKRESLMDAYRPLPGTPVEELDTPCLLVDLDAVENNYGVVAETYRDTVCKMRQHTKNIKSPRLARMQIDAGGTVGGVCTAKVSEAEVMVEGGVTDVLVANQVARRDKIARLCALARRAEVKVCADNAGNLRDLSEVASEHGRLRRRARRDTHRHGPRGRAQPGAGGRAREAGAGSSRHRVQGRHEPPELGGARPGGEGDHRAGLHPDMPGRRNRHRGGGHPRGGRLHRRDVFVRRGGPHTRRHRGGGRHLRADGRAVQLHGGVPGSEQGAMHRGEHAKPKRCVWPT